MGQRLNREAVPILHLPQDRLQRSGIRQPHGRSRVSDLAHPLQRPIQAVAVSAEFLLGLLQLSVLRQERQPRSPGEHLYPVVCQFFRWFGRINTVPNGGNQRGRIQIAAEMDLLGGLDQIHRLFPIQKGVVQSLQQLQCLFQFPLVAVGTGEDDFYPLLLDLVAHFQHAKRPGHRILPCPEILHSLQKTFAPFHAVRIVVFVPAPHKQGIFNIQPGIHGLREHLLGQRHPLLQFRQFAGVRRINRIAQNRRAKTLPAVYLPLDQLYASPDLVQIVLLQAAAFYHLQAHQNAVRAFFQLFPQELNVPLPLLRPFFCIRA